MRWTPLKLGREYNFHFVKNYKIQTVAICPNTAKKGQLWSKDLQVSCLGNKIAQITVDDISVI